MVRCPTVVVPPYELLDRLGVASWIFYPRRDHGPPPDGAEDHIVPVPGARLVCRLYVHGDRVPTVLYFHGNGEVVSDHDALAPLFARCGANLFVAEYRGYGASEGMPTFASLFSDAHVVLAYLRGVLERRGLPQRVVVFGRSLGGYPACELAATEPDLNGLILESAAVNLRRLAARAGAGGRTAELEELVRAHESRLRSIRVPVLWIHGEQDELIPLESALEAFNLIGSAEKRFVLIPGAGHNDILWRGLETYLGAVQAFIARWG